MSSEKRRIKRRPFERLVPPFEDDHLRSDLPRYYTLSRNFVHHRGGCATGKVGQPPPAGCAHHFW